MTAKQFTAGLRRMKIKNYTIRAEVHKEAITFVAVDRVIMLGSYCVGRMKSKNYAIRTANALNAYKPNDRGV
jgi:hypothetical protein